MSAVASSMSVQITPFRPRSLRLRCADCSKRRDTMTATDDFTDQIEALRKKKNKPFSGAKHGVVANAGGQLRRSASTAGITNTAQIDKLAVESVHSGIVVALDSDCRAYRAEITSLKTRNAELQDKLRPDSEHYAEKVKLADEVKQLRQTTERTLNTYANPD